MSDRLRVLDDLETPDLWDTIGRRQPRNERVAAMPRRHRAITLAVAAAVGLASILVAMSVIGPGGRDIGSLDTSTWTKHDVRPLHLTFRSPPEWHVQAFNGLVGHAGFAGAIVSNISHTFRHPDLGSDGVTTAWDLRGLPRDTIAISIEHLEALAVPRELRDTRLPLELAHAHSTTQYRPGADWDHLWLPFVLNGRHDGVRAWIGPDASGHDREIARRIVASISPIEQSFDGWTVGVEVEHSLSEPLQIGVGPIHAAKENDAQPWIQHEIILTNTGSEALHFDDTRISTFLGLPDPELLAADRGCGYARNGPNAPVEAGACLTYLDEFEIPPGGTVRRDVTLFKDLPGMEPLTEGQYVFEKIYRFVIGSSETKTTVHVRLIYDVEKA